MKIILLESIDRLGARGDVVDVKGGHGRNHLLPKKLAIRATVSNLRQIDTIKAQSATKEDKIRKQLTELAEKLGLASVKTTIKMGEEGAFGAITNADVADLLAKEGFEIDKRSIIIAEPIKAPGVYDVPVKMGHEVTATVKLWVAEEPA